jgi:hypothetical protein
VVYDFESQAAINGVAFTFLTSWRIANSDRGPFQGTTGQLGDGNRPSRGKWSIPMLTYGRSITGSRLTRSQMTERVPMPS